jgi:hypothetical protein
LREQAALAALAVLGLPTAVSAAAQVAQVGTLALAAEAAALNLHLHQRMALAAAAAAVCVGGNTAPRDFTTNGGETVAAGVAASAYWVKAQTARLAFSGLMIPVAEAVEVRAALLVSTAVQPTAASVAHTVAAVEAADFTANTTPTSKKL